MTATAELDTPPAGVEAGCATDAWQGVKVYGSGLQAHMGRWWDCDPAWDIVALYPAPDERIVRPSVALAGKPPSPTDYRYAFRDRHIDRRFRIAYPPTTAESTRPIGRTLGNPQREWETIIEHRDRYLAEAGLTLQSPPAAIARCLAETFLYDNHFSRKPHASNYPESQRRQLHHPVEGLLYQCYCAGCAPAFIAMAEASGLTTRKVGLGGHHAAEVLVDGRWRYIENSGRHEASRELAAYFPAGIIDITRDPIAYRDLIPDHCLDGYWKQATPQYHLTSGRWDSTLTLRLAGSNAAALYPELEHYIIKTDDPRRAPLVMRKNGFYWATTWAGEHSDLVALRRKNCPFDFGSNPPISDFLYHPVQPGRALRQSVWLGSLEDMAGLEVSIPLAPVPHVTFDAALGRQLVIRVGDFETSFADANAWPPEGPDNRGHLSVTITIPTEVLTPHAVNWIELHQHSLYTLMMPFIPASLEPYIPPLSPPAM